MRNESCSWKDNQTNERWSLLSPVKSIVEGSDWRWCWRGCSSSSFCLVIYWYPLFATYPYRQGREFDLNTCFPPTAHYLERLPPAYFFPPLNQVLESVFQRSIWVTTLFPSLFESHLGFFFSMMDIPQEWILKEKNICFWPWLCRRLRVRYRWLKRKGETPPYI